jgi:hypothetical protein
MDSAMCPAGYVATGGGGFAGGSSSLHRSNPTQGSNGTPNGWQAQGSGNSGVTAYAICVLSTS